MVREPLTKIQATSKPDHLWPENYYQEYQEQLRTPRIVSTCTKFLPRIPRSWLEHLDDETWDVVDLDDVESWVSQDILKTCASFELVSELDCCQIGMIAIVMGDVDAVYTLERVLVARALNERSLLIRGLPFPHTKTIGDRHSQRFALFGRTYRFVAHRSSARRRLVRPLADADKCEQVRQYTRGRVLGGAPGRRFRHARVPSRSAGFAHCWSLRWV